MTRPIITIHNSTTGEIINREMNDFEYEQHLKDIADEETRKSELAQAEAEAEAKRSAALAKLEGLGLNEDDLKALGF